MPLFDYICPDGHVQEVLVRKPFPRFDVLVCPDCNKLAARRGVEVIAQPQRLDGWGGDFELPSDARDGLDEMIGHKRQARATLAEAKENGWERGSRRKSF